MKEERGLVIQHPYIYYIGVFDLKIDCQRLWLGVAGSEGGTKRKNEGFELHTPNIYIRGAELQKLTVRSCR